MESFSSLIATCAALTDYSYRKRHNDEHTTSKLRLQAQALLVCVRWKSSANHNSPIPTRQISSAPAVKRMPDSPRHDPLPEARVGSLTTRLTPYQASAANAAAASSQIVAQPQSALEIPRRQTPTPMKSAL